MALTRDIEQVIKEFDYNLYAVAEALADLREESEKKISELQEEINNHECQ